MPKDLAETDEFAVNKAGTTCRLQVDDAIRPATYTLAGVPTASSEGAGAVIYVSNGAAGSPIIAYSDGITWLRSDTGGAISAT